MRIEEPQFKDAHVYFLLIRNPVGPVLGLCRKKGDHWYSSRVLEGQLAELGYKRVIIRSDQEPAIKKLKETVKRVSDTQIVCEESPVGESKSLGSVNVQIQALQGMVRTLRDAMESRYGNRLESTKPSYSLARHARCRNPHEVQRVEMTAGRHIKR